MALKNISGQPSASSVVSANAQEITGAKSKKSSEAGATVASLAQAQTANAAKGVDVAVSDAAKTRASEARKAKELAMKAPDVREDRVAALKAKIADGTYQIDSEKIAEGMVRDSIMEHLASDWNQ
jgi:negative regulator of flagellin synthesis FlgM